MIDLAIHQLVGAMNCFTWIICPFEMDLVLYDIWFDVFEHEHCCSPLLYDEHLVLPQLVLV